MKLYSYYRSSAAYRVRIALNLKGITAEQAGVNLLEGVHRGADYRMTHPQGLVPALAVDENTVLTQSIAIIEYLDECYPEPPLLPADPLVRARVRGLAHLIACDIHPLNNLRVLNYLTTELHATTEQRQSWYQHWVTEGFNALERQLGDGPYCFGETPTLADLVLVPQVYNARRFDCDLTLYPQITAIAERCEALAAFRDAAPERQPDAP